MIENLHIQRFKSVRDLSLNCRRINVLIGPPNSGKSNILEALGMFSFLYYGPHGPYNLGDFVRFEGVNNLFYDDDLTSPLAIICDDMDLHLEFSNGAYQGTVSREKQRLVSFGGGHDNLNVHEGPSPDFQLFNYYRFQPQVTFPGREGDYLRPPYGNNLSVLHN